METNKVLIDNFTNGFVTMSDFKYLITNVFKGNYTDISLLERIGSRNHPFSQDPITNNDFHTSLIEEQITKVCSTDTFNKNKKDYVISRISLSKSNRINIDLHIQKINDKIQFYLVGSDLKDYFMFLPKLGHYPHTGSLNSKWYGYEYKSYMIKIALGLKLIEIMLFGIKIQNIYNINETKTGILGLEVQFEIPTKYKTYDMLNLQSSTRCSLNPIKISDGIFLYGKNGINHESSNKIISILRTFSHISDLLFPTIITNYDLIEFNTSTYHFAICSWNNHARILVKTGKINIMIIDPWMKFLPRIISNSLSLVLVNSGIKVGFFSRNQKDQTSEGSCMLCILARLIFMIDSEESIEKNICKPIPDFYAYFVKKMYLNI